ncbi:hypothetical protein TIFTF001_018573 [Ficus carica]|uniref:Uncharacterized protein n=1 Tax=Ficus carica TaxID=3494 RepID=A0AA88DBS5_FICCA|nr:hypothetical protein TIFTF001_018573 [Ficus carica]
MEAGERRFGGSKKKSPNLSNISNRASHKFRSSGDPDGSRSEWSRRVDTLQVYRYLTSTKRMPRALPFEGWGDTGAGHQYWCRRLVLCQFGQVVEGDTGIGTRTGAVICTGCQVSGGAEYILELDGDLLEVPKGDVVRGSAAQRRCRWVNLMALEWTLFTIATRLLWSSWVLSGDRIFSIGMSNRAYQFSCTSFPGE